LSSFIDTISEKKFITNVVIKLRGVYYSIRQPDSGLTIPKPLNRAVSSLNLNPTSIDPLRPTTTINNSSFRILDKNGSLSADFASNPNIFLGELAEVWIGKIAKAGEQPMDFSDYFKLPDTFIQKVSKQDSSYSFSTQEAKDRLSTGAFQKSTKLFGDITSGTTTITLQNADLFPNNGLIKINDEFISYTGKSGNNLTGCVRAANGSVATDHSLADDVFLAFIVQGNPITLLLQILISAGGGGIYDALQDGSGISESLIDIAEFESVRDSFFGSTVFRLALYDIQNLREFIENELLYPLGLRLRSNNTSLIGLAVLNAPTINTIAPNLTHDEIKSYPKYDVDDTKIYNRLSILWNYDDNFNKFLSVSTYEDAASISLFGQKPEYKLQFKGIKENQGGQGIVDNIAVDFFARFSKPRPTISLSALFSSYPWLLGEKAGVETNLLPNDQGLLDFADNLEVISKSVNVITGDISYKLQFTQFTGVNLCFIAPSDIPISKITQSIFELPAGRGSLYMVGWPMRFWDEATESYSELRTIANIVGDTVYFDSVFTTTITSLMRLTFPDYTDATEEQKRYCFQIAEGETNFPDGKPAYQITF